MARRTARLATALLLAGACLLAGGCGSSSSNSRTAGGAGAASPADAAFKRAFIAQLGGLRNVGTELTVALAKAPAQSDAEVHKAFGDLSKQVVPVVAGIGGLQAPARYRADVATLHHYLSRAQRDLRAVSRTAAAHQADKVKRAFARLESDSAVVKAADHRLTTGLGIPVS